METTKSLLLLCTVLAACLALAAAGWSPGTATFYGGADGSGTMVSDIFILVVLCYDEYAARVAIDNLYNAGYGVNNAALSTTLFNDGASCGQCYKIICDQSHSGGQYCKPGNSITVTATNLCPPNYALPNGGWCGPGRPHFDMAQPAWEHIGVFQAGIVPVLYQQVRYSRSGGVRFSIAGSNYFLLVNIQNLGGSGSVAAAWGANWQPLSGLVGQSLSFAVTSTGGQYIQFLNVVPSWWQFGMAFSTNKNFVR
ncbi:hypothetical protein PVAP13_9KG203500 [Panicum virgatum]|uniref:Expansin n=1 Tax=Panicum virgatum TaxID=38727 RepID=A0A8T0NJT1_PANVG|nr:hypothetical protein PVAP13_9KG203500 [Panicum virgatum]